MINHLQTDGQQSSFSSPPPGHEESGQGRHGDHGARTGDICQDLAANRDLYRSQEVRPPFTYAALIKQALSEAPGRQMNLNEIYSW